MGKKKTDFYTFLVFRKDCFPTDEESDSEKKKTWDRANVMENCELFQEELIKQQKSCDTSAKKDDSIAWKPDSGKKKKNESSN